MTLSTGSTGPEVRAWQQALIARGYALIDDGVFGPRTHNATCAWQAKHGLPTTGEVGQVELALLEDPFSAVVRQPPRITPRFPLVLAAHYKQAVRVVVDLIVLHCMEAPESSTTAESCAAYFARGERIASAHYCVDSDSIVQCVPDHCVALAAPGANLVGLQIELAGYARQTAKEWADDYSTRMLWLAAQLVARKCSERGIPAEFVPAARLLGKRPRGITTHHEVSQAYRRSSHHDPGPHFPMAHFLAQVQMVIDQQAGIA
jgi:N-acetyl-anhydromuramyl-L-alanine amidase AmpD